MIFVGIGIAERINDPDEQQMAVIQNELAKLHAAMPGIIQSFDPIKQTAVVQPAVNENIQLPDTDARSVALPLLADVPVQFPRGGGYCMTLPVKPGDECLLVFADTCIDGWWQSGGIQNQMDHRRHDLSDAIAVMGVSSVPRAVNGYSPDALRIQSDDGKTYVELDGDKITLKASKVTVDGDLSVTGTTDF